MHNWIDIVEYAKKYGISASTLRRRIRTRSIAFKLEKGKYLLADTEELLREAPLFSRQGRVLQTQQNHIPTQVVTQSLGHDFVQNFDTPESRSQDLVALQAEHLRVKRELDVAIAENRKLRAQISELEMLVKVLEAAPSHA